MTTFEKLFGTKESGIKNTCILIPFLSKDFLKLFDIRNFSKGMLYDVGAARNFSLIHTGLGPAFLGDAVLHLKNTACRNIILFGSCGAVDDAEGLAIGSLVAPSKCYALESFSQILLKKDEDWPYFEPHSELYEGFLNENVGSVIKEVTNATLGSLKLESEIAHLLKNNGVHTVEMECSATFAASRHIKRRAIAFLYVTDIIGKKPFYGDFTPEEKYTLLSSKNKAINILCEFIEKNLAS